jgi:hypothetical protein
MERSGSLAGFSRQLTNGEMSGVKNAMAQVINDDLDHDGVVVERKVVPRHTRTSPLAVIVLIAFAITCAYVFFGGNIRTPANTPVAPTPTTAPQ